MRKTLQSRQRKDAIYRRYAVYGLQYHRPVSAWHQPKYSWPTVTVAPWLIALTLVIIGLTGIISWSKHAAAERAQEQRIERIRRQHTITAGINSKLAQFNWDYPQLGISIAVAGSRMDSQFYGSESAFDAASTAKVLSAVCYLRLQESGRQPSALHLNGAPVSTLLEKMIVDSDDAAWETLNGAMGHPYLQHCAETIGLKNFTADSNMMPASDMALLLGKLYQADILTRQHTDQLLSYMSRANHKEFILASIPTTMKAYHKIGMNEDEVNDAAVISRGNDWLVLVIYSNGNGSYNWQQRELIFHQLTAQVLRSYFDQESS